MTIQSARRSGFPHDLQTPSSSFANKSSSTTRLPVTGYSHFDKETLSTILSLSLSFLLLPFHKFPPLCLNHAFPKRPFFSRASFPARKAAIIFCCQLCVCYAQYRLRSEILRNHLKWYTDNQSVSRIVEVGSMKEDLQCLALRIFSMCLLSCVTLEVEWIPRSGNDRANFLSRIVDYDDWQVKRDYFLLAEEKWGPHSVERFANHENTQLPCFNSRFWCPGTEVVDAFSFSWVGANNWLVPPIFLIPKVLNRMVALGGCGTLVVRAWPSAPFWPLIFTDEGLSPIFSDIFEIPLGNDVFVLGIIKIPFLDHLIFVQGFCSCSFPREALR